VTHLRNMVLEELQRRNYSQNTTKIYNRTNLGVRQVLQTARPRNSAPSISASSKLTCFSVRNWRPTP